MKKNYKFKRQFLLLSLFLALTFSAFAQKTETAKTNSAGRVSKQTLDSKLMAREMPYNLLLPKNYNDEASKEMRIPVIYLLHGLTVHYNNWAEMAKIEQHAANYDLIIVMHEDNE